MSDENCHGAPMERHLIDAVGADWKHFSGKWRELAVLELYRQFEDVSAIAALFNTTEEEINEIINGTSKWESRLDYLWGLYNYAEIQRTIQYHLRYSRDSKNNKNPDRSGRAVQALVAINLNATKKPDVPTETDEEFHGDPDAAIKALKEEYDSAED